MKRHCSHLYLLNFTTGFVLVGLKNSNDDDDDDEDDEDVHNMQSEQFWAFAHKL